MVIPAWPILNLASAVEWLNWAYTLGSKKSKVFRRRLLSYMCTQKTYSIEEGKRRLGSVPMDNRDDEIQKGMEG